MTDRTGAAIEVDHDEMKALSRFVRLGFDKSVGPTSTSSAETRSASSKDWPSRDIRHRRGTGA